MSTDTPLFGDDPAPHPPVASAGTPAGEWQVDLVRKALDRHGLSDQTDRKAAVEQHAGRPLTSLRDLTADEAMRVLSALGAASGAARGAPTASAWDDRDEDTWIDRL